MTLRLLARRWARRRAAGDLLAAAAVLVLWVAVVRGSGAGAGFAAAGVVVLGGALAWRARRWRADEGAVARHLDRAFPELEESAELLLSTASWSGLRELQRQRAENALQALAVHRLLPSRPLARGALLCLLALAAFAPLAWLTRAACEGVSMWRAASSETVAGSAEATDASWELRYEVEVHVTPPAYTAKAARRGSDLSIEVLEGSRVEWRVRAAGMGQVAVAVEGDDPLALDLDAGVFRGVLEPTASALYRLRFTMADGAASETGLARLSVVPDEPPEVAILEPGRLVEAEDGVPPRLVLRARAEDDHGVAEAVLVSTLATGSGELVEFRERRITFDSRRELEAAGRAFELAVGLDTAQLGLAAGSELYLWVEARDRRPPDGQAARSDTVIVRVPGERAAAAGLGEGLPVFQLPQFFRSQRQIILDTERLLAEAARLGEMETGHRSEGLGFDQRALRLRYAGLLGEEFESGLPAGLEEGGGEDAEPGELEVTSVDSALEALPEGLVHFHDSAEIATYFDDEVKQLLKGALAEMWQAEGALRGHRPRQALPFEYRALALLKRAQAAERVYVGKVGFEAQPIDPSRRLSGELDEASGTVRREEPAPEGEGDDDLLARLLLLLIAPDRPAPAEVQRLLESGRERVARAAAEGGGDELLEAVDLMARWRATGAPPSGEEGELLERVIQRLAAEPRRAPPRVPDHDDPRFAAYLERLGEGG